MSAPEMSWCLVNTKLFNSLPSLLDQGEPQQVLEEGGAAIKTTCHCSVFCA